MGNALFFARASNEYGIKVSQPIYNLHRILFTNDLDAFQSPKKHAHEFENPKWCDYHSLRNVCQMNWHLMTSLC